jgi:hypothetical protein
VNEQGFVASVQLKSNNKEIDFQQAFGHYTSNITFIDFSFGNNYFH